MRALAVFLLASSLLWLGAILIAPVTRGPLSAAAYLAGGFVCHQRPERSFHLAGNSMPVCARCTGLYASAPAGALVALVMRRRRPVASSRVRGALLVAATPTLVAAAVEWLGLARPSPALRAIAAAPLGAAAAWIVTRAIASGDAHDRIRADPRNPRPYDRIRADPRTPRPDDAARRPAGSGID